MVLPTQARLYEEEMQSEATLNQWCKYMKSHYQIIHHTRLRHKTYELINLVLYLVSLDQNLFSYAIRI